LIKEKEYKNTIMDANTEQYKDITEDPQVKESINNLFGQLQRYMKIENKFDQVYRECENEWVTDAIIDRDVDRLIDFARHIKDIAFSP